MLPHIEKSIKQLEGAGAQFIILPCNTLHALLPELKKQTKLEITDLVDETSREAKKFGKIAVLGTSKTINERLYEEKIFEVIYPNILEQKIISEIIVRIIRKISTPEDSEYIIKVMSRLKKKGAEKIIFACTDLSNLGIVDTNIIDSQNILIRSILKKMKE